MKLTKSIVSLLFILLPVTTPLSTNAAELRNTESDLCLDVAEDRHGGNVVIGRCQGTSKRPYQVWKVDGDKLRNIESDLCLDVAEDRHGGNVVIARCQGTSKRPYQDWGFN